MAEPYQEALEELSGEAKNVHRAIVSLIEELQAVDWYNQRVDVTPDEELSLCPGDQLLFCGPEGTAERMRWVLQNANALSYVRTGEEKPDGYIWRWLSRHGT